MKALVLESEKQALLYKETDSPKAKNDKVVVDIKAAALNHRDVYVTQGLYPGVVFPIILGSDGAGLYEDREVIINPSLNWGENPNFQQKSYKILGLPDNGTFAEQVLVPENKIHEKPAHLSFEQAAALPLAGLTAYRALFTKCQLQKGEKVLISGIGGGVALFACQFAIAAGAEVYVTSGSDEKIAKAVEFGAKGGANYKSDEWTKDLKQKAGGFDVIIDSAGGEGFSNFMKIANPGCRIAIYGGTRGKIQNLSPQILFWKQISIFGTSMGNDDDFKNMLDFVNQHQIIPIVDSVFDLKDGNAALDRMDKGLQFGKIVLKVS
jgi:NADPH:quinone reductase-like Zn-dependent oxidoreductase